MVNHIMVLNQSPVSFKASDLFDPPHHRTLPCGLHEGHQVLPPNEALRRGKALTAVIYVVAMTDPDLVW